MKLTIICMGKTRERFIHDGIVKYMRYLNPYVDLEIRELREEKIHDLKDAPRIRKKEAERILKVLPKNVFIAALDERGQAFTSHEFAAVINGMLETGIKEIAFVIGGAMGLDECILEKANKNMALSRWTLTHEMARLVLLEQLYRAFTIIKGKTYHY